MSVVSIAPTEGPTGVQPFTAPTSNPAKGMLTGHGQQGMLTCGGYRPADPVSFQFYIGSTNRSDLTYKVTDTVKNSKAANLQFCLGATFPFTTRSGKPARAFKLPNGLSGFAGLLPPCNPAPTPPCLASKSQAPPPNGQDAVLNVLVPTTGDPWGRA